MHALLRGWTLPLATMLLVCASQGGRAETRRSGQLDMSPSLQVMQRDDAQNPGMLWVKEGETLWSQRAGAAALSCASCHGEAGTSMRGVAARYPRLDAGTGLPIDLGQRIAQCRQQRQQAPALAPESQPRLALESYLAFQSRGLSLSPDTDPRLEPFAARGMAAYRRRIGQLNLSCMQCHDDQAGARLAGSVIPQAHVTGYPTYRLEWQGMGSLQRRLRGCMIAVRAEAPAPDALPLVELQLYLARRSAGLPMESPAVRP